MLKKILIVEDNDNSLKLFSTLLKCSGYQTLEARTSSDAILLARQEKPHLILLDIRLSLLNRFETLKMLSNEPSTKHIPSIAITTNPVDGQREEIVKLGFADCISRQINVKDFMDVIERHLRS
ncbi:MAG: response regulator [Thermodesulfovibrionales bacterium]|nr:response regulator [Thermodesulfovibrionales bacterium]